MEKRKKDNIDFMNFANVDAKTWYQFKKSVTNHNTQTDDKVIIAHAARVDQAIIGRLVTESGERISFPISELS